MWTSGSSPLFGLSWFTNDMTYQTNYFVCMHPRQHLPHCLTYFSSFVVVLSVFQLHHSQIWGLCCVCQASGRSWCILCWHKVLSRVFQRTSLFACTHGNSLHTCLTYFSSFVVVLSVFQEQHSQIWGLCCVCQASGGSWCIFCWHKLPSHVLHRTRLFACNPGNTFHTCLIYHPSFVCVLSVFQEMHHFNVWVL